MGGRDDRFPAMKNGRKGRQISSRVRSTLGLGWDFVSDAIQTTFGFKEKKAFPSERIGCQISRIADRILRGPMERKQ